MPVSLDDLRDFANTTMLPFGLRVLVALVVFVIGRWIAKGIMHAMDRVMARSNVDVSLRKFLGSLVYAMMFTAVAIAALDSLGVRTTAVVAVLGAAGLAVGLALQGSLSNFAAGVMLILLRPYKIGDLVTIGKYTARVDSIQVFNTVLITADYRQITIPNGQIIAQPIENLTALGRRRVDLVVTINQATELPVLKAVLIEAMVDPRVLPEPAAAIEVAEVTDTTTKVFVRPWTSNVDYSATQTETIERIKRALEAKGLKFSIAMQTPAT